MNENENTPYRWQVEDHYYFLRDDQALGITKQETYSLFRKHPDYGRVIVIGISNDIDWVLDIAGEYVREDLFGRLGVEHGPREIFLQH